MTTKEKKQQRLAEASRSPLFLQIRQLHKLLKVYSTLDENPIWQQIVTYGGRCISLRALSVMFNIPESNMFIKLKPLRDVGLLKTNEMGRVKCYAPVMDVCLQVEAFVDEMQEKDGHNVCEYSAENLRDLTGALSSPLTFLIWNMLPIYDGGPLTRSQIAAAMDCEYVEVTRAVEPSLHWAFGTTETNEIRYYPLGLRVFQAAMHRIFIATGTIPTFEPEKQVEHA